MFMFPSADLLETEFNEGWLDADGLKQYVDMGNITQDQFNKITGNNQSSSNTNSTPVNG